MRGGTARVAGQGDKEGEGRGPTGRETEKQRNRAHLENTVDDGFGERVLAVAKQILHEREGAEEGGRGRV